MSARKKPKQRKAHPTPPKLTIMWDAHLDYARQLLAEIEPFAAVRRAEALASKDGEAPS